MAWWLTAPSHCLSHCWSSSMGRYVIVGPQWVNQLPLTFCFSCYVVDSWALGRFVWNYGWASLRPIPVIDDWPFVKWPWDAYNWTSLIIYVNIGIGDGSVPLTQSGCHNHGWPSLYVATCHRLGTMCFFSHCWCYHWPVRYKTDEAKKYILNMYIGICGMYACCRVHICMHSYVCTCAHAELVYGLRPNK